MNRTRCAALAASALALVAVSARGDDADRDAVKAVVRSAYVEGVHVKLDPARMRAGFHPDFRMFVLRDGVLATVTLEEWISRLETGARERKGPPAEVRHEFTLVDVTGNAAVARVELHRDGRHVFTDYISLYRFPEGWKIVGKIFHTHKS
jgi:ketosteroid isomerase-like protein